MNLFELPQEILVHEIFPFVDPFTEFILRQTAKTFREYFPKRNIRYNSNKIFVKAAEYGNPSLCRWALEENPCRDVEIDWLGGFRLAAKRGHFEFIKHLITKYSIKYRFPLEHLVNANFIRGRADVIDYLVDLGVPFSTRNAIEGAAAIGDVSSIQFLFISNKIKPEDNVLEKALRAGNSEVAMFILANTDSYRLSTLDLESAALGGNVEIFDYITALQRNVQPYSYSQHDMVAKALRSRNPDMVRRVAQDYGWWYKVEKNLLLAVELDLYECFQVIIIARGSEPTSYRLHRVVDACLKLDRLWL